MTKKKVFDRGGVVVSVGWSAAAIWLGAYYDRRLRGLFLMLPFLGIRVDFAGPFSWHRSPRADDLPPHTIAPRPTRSQRRRRRRRRRQGGPW